MTWDFCVKTTSELSSGEIAALTHLFTLVYQRPCSEELFLRKFAKPSFGRSLHSLMFLDGELVGACSAIQVRFRFYGQELKFANTADLMINPRHRNSIPRFIKLAENLYEGLAGDGVAFVFACLREQMATFNQRLSDWRAIGKVHYYVAPLRIPWLRPLSILMRTGVGAWNRFRPTVIGSRKPEFAIEKVNDAAFADYRYRVFPIKYKTVALTGVGTAIYSTSQYYPIKGIPPWLRFGLLLDVFPLNGENFDEAVRAIRRREPELHALAYQGNLPFQPRQMLLVPAKYEKQAWMLTGRILCPDLIDDRVFEIGSWNINLSNGDLV